MARLGCEVVALVVVIAILCTNNYITVKGADDLEKKCVKEFDKVQVCREFATGKEDAPSKECCKSASELAKKEPVCLCYMVLQTSKGSSLAKSGGLRVDRLLALPKSCNIPNAEPSQCPELLKLPAGSPENVIFNGSFAAPTKGNHESNGFRIGPNYSTPYIAAAAVSSIVWSFFG